MIPTRTDHPRRAALAAAPLALLLACESAPYEHLARDPCLAGNVRDGDVACGLHRTSDAGESLAAAPAIPLAADCGGCGLALPAQLRGALLIADETWLWLDVTLADGGAPVTSDPDVRYVLRLSAGKDHPHRATDTVAVGADGARYLKSGREVTGVEGWAPALQHGWRADGFWVRFPRSLVPFPGGVSVTAYVERRVDGRWVPVAAPPAPAPLCWDFGDLTADPCHRR